MVSGNGDHRLWHPSFCNHVCTKVRSDDKAHEFRQCSFVIGRRITQCTFYGFLQAANLFLNCFSHAGIDGRHFYADVAEQTTSGERARLYRLRSTSNPSVWVAGDALVHSAQLSPVATYEGKLVGHNIVNGSEKQPDYAVIPSAVYTVPALSSVGLMEDEAVKAGLDVDIKISDMSGWFSSRFYAETASWAKVVIDKQTRRIVGANMFGHHGEELIHLFVLAMRHAISADELGGEMYAFPTFSADVSNLV